jgi:hypothetical protein
MPGLKFLDPHRRAYEVMKTQIEATGKYMVNNQVAAKKAGKLNVRAAQSYLWSQIQLLPGSSSYLFQVKDGVPNAGANNILPMERRLKDQDVFFTYALGFYLLVARTAGSSAAAQFQLMSFPSAQFDGSTGYDEYTLRGLWTAGVLSIKINGEILTPQWEMSQHLCINQTQFPRYTSLIPGSIFPPFDQIDMSSDGLIAVEPNWIINGGNNNEYIVSYPSNYSNIGIPDPATNNFQMYLVMKWQGFLAQNISSIMDNS